MENDAEEDTIQRLMEEMEEQKYLPAPPPPPGARVLPHTDPPCRLLFQKVKALKEKRATHAAQHQVNPAPPGTGAPPAAEGIVGELRSPATTLFPSPPSNALLVWRPPQGSAPGAARAGTRSQPDGNTATADDDDDDDGEDWETIHWRAKAI